MRLALGVQHRHREGAHPDRGLALVQGVAALADQGEFGAQRGRVGDGALGVGGQRQAVLGRGDDTFILSGYPLLEESYRVAETILPALRGQRGPGGVTARWRRSPGPPRRSGCPSGRRGP
ncbi:hypothetical protein GCM10023235_68050 [Kitasatospora terrestris]|uniref:Alkanesulfonate monooxygenase n=1 Tax=Kitasatospora terrestris TaxID=258051 RepID=A0ABP9EGN4_9ACTN